MSQKIKFTSKQADLPNLNFGINVKNFGSVSSNINWVHISLQKQDYHRNLKKLPLGLDLATVMYR
jgi:hypothetical protein